MLSRRSLITAAPAFLHQEPSRSSTQGIYLPDKTNHTPNISAIITRLNNPEEGCAVFPLGYAKISLPPSELYESIVQPSNILIEHQTKNHKLVKSRVTPYAKDLIQLHEWFHHMGCTLATEDGRADELKYATTTTHVRIQEVGSRETSEVERWHIDGSFLTLISILYGKGTDIAPQYTTVPRDAEHIIQDFQTLKQGETLIMNGGQRKGCKWTVHRAPMSEGKRLVIVSFFSL